MRCPAFAPFACALALLTATAAAQAPAPDFRFLQAPPVGLPPMPAPTGPPATAAMFALGQHLFGDPILSVDRTISCQSCHPPQNGFASPEPRPAGVLGRRARAHAPSLLNRGWGKSMRWDGSTPDLVSFVLQPIADADEMGFTVQGALERLRLEPPYAKDFAAAFPDGVTEANLATALATFVRGIAAGNTPLDRFLHGEVGVLTVAQKAGLWVFESKGGCWRCHTPPLFTDESFHNTGIGATDGVPRPGRQSHTQDAADLGRFKTPTLRGVSHSAPYMHDASLATLEDVVAFYVRGGNPNSNLDPQLKPVPLTEQEQHNLLVFLRSL